MNDISESADKFPLQPVDYPPVRFSAFFTQHALQFPGKNLEQGR
jgi:hypothetical protein